MTPFPFGFLPSGQPVESYTLDNGAGSSVRILTYGGIVASLRVPDRQARLADVVLGFDNLEAYLGDPSYQGAVVGRIAGRVSGGRLPLEGRTLTLALNDGANHLHGGSRGLSRRVWTAEPVTRPDGAASLRLSYLSPDGEEGYPGNVSISVTYTLTATNAFIFDTEATADRPTPLSLTQHSYFNLAGEGSGGILDHEVQIHADEFVPTDGAMTLSGRRAPVAGSAADFRRPRMLGEALPTLFRAHGDLYLLGSAGAPAPQAPRLAARVTEGGCGRALEVFTDDSCLQFYTGAALNGSLVGKSGVPYGPHAGFCMECHGYPNALLQGSFGDILVRPGRPQRRRTIYEFSTC